MKYLRKFETEAERDSWLNGMEHIKPNVVLIRETDKVEYNVYIDYTKMPLFIEAIDDVTISFSNTYEYSKDNEVWDSGASSTAISAMAGERVFFRAIGLTPSSSSGIGTFTISNGTCNVGGNIMSMIYGDDYKEKTTVAAYQFYSLFKSVSAIVNTYKLELPATTLAESCYQSMFSGCTSLVTAPKLPATTLATGCYRTMFINCTSLVTAPELPATTLAASCYYSMFFGCASLVTAPELPATTLAESCYQSMFYNCTSMVAAPQLPAKSLVKECYWYMFFGCASLVTAPELPATTLASSCYADMFNGCSKLNYVKAMFTTKPSSSYTSNWLFGVAATGTFVKNAAATWSVTGVNGIPSGWTVETAAA